MIDDKNYETYLLISSKKLIISVNKFSNEKIYFNELKLDKFSNEIIFDKLDNFLNENVFKIEKILNDFVKNIFVIFDVENLFSFGFPIALIAVFVFLYAGVGPISDAFSDLTGTGINLIEEVLQSYQKRN